MRVIDAISFSRGTIVRRLFGAVACAAAVMSVLLLGACASVGGQSLDTGTRASCGARGLPKQLHAAGVLGHERVDGKLQVRTYVQAVCNAEVRGRFYVKGKVIHLRYTENLPSSPTKCRCARVYKHTLDVPPGDYTFKVTRE